MPKRIKRNLKIPYVFGVSLDKITEIMDELSAIERDLELLEDAQVAIIDGDGVQIDILENMDIIIPQDPIEEYTERLLKDRSEKVALLKSAVGEYENRVLGIFPDKPPAHAPAPDANDEETLCNSILDLIHNIEKEPGGYKYVGPTFVGITDRGRNPLKDPDIGVVARWFKHNTIPFSHDPNRIEGDIMKLEYEQLEDLKRQILTNFKRIDNE